MATTREGWGEEYGSMIHLASELAVSTSEGSFPYEVFDLEDEPVAEQGFFSREAAMDWVDREYARNPRHSHNWR